MSEAWVLERAGVSLDAATSSKRGWKLSRVIAELACRFVEETAESWAIEYVRPAFAGDVKAAMSLSGTLGNANRGFAAVAMWRARIPHPAFRAFLANVWDHDHRYLIAAAQTRRRLAAMFRYAAFPMPAELPDVVRVWRGTSALDIAEARKGYAWTIDYDVACWFAMRFEERNGMPLVLASEVRREDIALFHDEREERETVLMAPPRSVAIDGRVEDWRMGCERQAQRIRRCDNTFRENFSLSAMPPQ